MSGWFAMFRFCAYLFMATVERATLVYTMSQTNETHLHLIFHFQVRHCNTGIVDCVDRRFAIGVFRFRTRIFMATVERDRIVYTSTKRERLVSIPSFLSSKVVIY